MERLNSLERCGARELAPLGVLVEYPMLRRDHEEEVQTEINEEQPAFLRGRMSHLCSGDAFHGPVKMVKNPEGSLQRAT
jgi:hypothetical protein